MNGLYIMYLQVYTLTKLNHITFHKSAYNSPHLMQSNNWSAYDSVLHLALVAQFNMKTILW